MQTEIDHIDHVLEKIYGRPSHNGRWSPEDLEAGRKLVRVHHVTPVRAAWLMERIIDHGYWSGVIQSPMHLAHHYERCAAQIDAENNKRKVYDPDRPYDNPNNRQQPDRASLRPEEMFLGIKDPELALKRDQLVAKIHAAERRGLRGPALFKAVLGNTGKGLLGNFGALPAAVVADAEQDCERAAAAEQPVDLPEVFDLVATRAELVATLGAAPDQRQLGEWVAHIPRLIQWCDANPEAGQDEYRRASVQLRTLGAAGVTV